MEGGEGIRSKHGSEMEKGQVTADIGRGQKRGVARHNGNKEGKRIVEESNDKIQNPSQHGSEVCTKAQSLLIRLGKITLDKRKTCRNKEGDARENGLVDESDS